MKVNERLVMTPTIEFAASSQKSLAGGIRSEGRQLPRINLGLEVTAILLRIPSGSTCGDPEILGDEVLPKIVFWSNTTSGNCLTLTTTSAYHDFLELASKLIAMSPLTFLHFYAPF